MIIYVYVCTFMFIVKTVAGWGVDPYKNPPLDFHCKMRGLVLSKKCVSGVIF